MRPFFSIIIPTYNSEKTLRFTLESIRNQVFDQEQLEILVIDGGSKDDTLRIAKEYNAKIISNPYRLPEYAKAIGNKMSQGQYIMRMDSDEEFSYETQLKDKKEFLMMRPDINAIIPNTYIQGRKELCGIASRYINVLGDPFSYFVYRTKRNKYETYNKKIIYDDGKNVVLSFENGDPLPLVDSSTSIMCTDYIRKQYADSYDSIEFACSAYDWIIRDTGICGLIKKDDVAHNCSSTLRVYLSKLKFRVVNNLFHKGESGFSSRQSNKKLTVRKYLFVLYAAIIPLPLLDSVRLSIRNRHWSFLLHFFYVYYVCAQIVIQLIKGKLFRRDVKNASYGVDV